MSFPNTAHVGEDTVRQTYTKASTFPWSNEPLPRGQRAELADGRIYRFGIAGASELAANKLNQNIAADANLDTLAVQAAAAVGDLTIAFTNATTFLDQDEIAGGYIAVESAAALGACYRVVSNTASVSGATTCIATLAVPVEVALTTSHKVTPIYPLGHECIIVPDATATGPLMGANPVVIGASKYGWFQRRGIGTCLIAGTVVVGNILIASATAGAVGPAATQTTTLTQNVGTAVEVAPTTDFGLVNFTLE